jgi:hypothetical protein
LRLRCRLLSDRLAFDRALYRQALRLEEHDDPNHPVVALAKHRNEELSGRRNAIDERTRQLKAAQPAGATAEEIEALLDSVPDLRPIMQQASPDELTELFAAFDLRRPTTKSSERYGSQRRSVPH